VLEQDFTGALAALAQGLQSHPRHPDLLFHSACTLLDWGRYREAHDAFVAARQEGYVETSLHLNLALSCYWRGAVAEAERHAREALAADPASAATLVGLGTILRSTGRYADAHDCFERACAVARTIPKS
jgi:Flp pilus assembly protein TadD